MRAILLAAGRRHLPGREQPILAEPLAGRWVIDYVAANAASLVPPEATVVVVPPAADAIRTHLGDRYRYAVQEPQRGTGHAVQQALPLLEGESGDLLILYGDTPLLSPTSIRGLFNRHRLTRADLTLLSAVVAAPLPYGRIVRDAAGRVIDVVEEEEASQELRGIRELNLGAYAVRAEPLRHVLGRAAATVADGELRLTDCVHHLLRSGLKVSSHRAYDEDESLGINTADDLQRAEFILERRAFKPRRVEDEGIIRFGTGGWRAIIGEGFSIANVCRLAQALANEVIRAGVESRGVVIGFDRRFLSDRAAAAAAEVFVGNNVAVTLLTEDAPTPVITFATVAAGAAFGLAFTASHNAPEWNGLKVFSGDGALLLTADTDRLEAEANALAPRDVVRIDLEVAARSGVLNRGDFTNAYLDATETLLDMPAIRGAGLKVVFDPMYGTGKHTLEALLAEARCRVATIHGRHDPLFGGRSPAPDPRALGLLSATVKEGAYDLGMATDGDADRIAIVDESGEYIDIHDLLLLLYYHLHETRQLRGGVVRNVATTCLLDRLAARFGERCIETPVGFKHVMTAMQKHNALLGGESSGGLAIRGHILGKDGILAAGLVVEMVARSRQRLAELRERIYALTGRMVRAEECVAATSDMRILVPKRLAALQPDEAAPLAPSTASAVTSIPPVRAISRLDGTKLMFADDASLLIRFSGTEPVLRLYAEATTATAAAALIAWGKAIIGVAERPLPG